MARRSDQTEIPGTEPNHPEINEALLAWLDEKDERAAAGERVKTKHAILLARMAEAGVTQYPYTDRSTGKRMAILAATSTTAKVVTARQEQKARRRDEASETAATAAKPQRARVEPVDDDPFGATRAAMTRDEMVLEGDDPDVIALARRDRLARDARANSDRDAEMALAAGDPDALAQAERESSELEAVARGKRSARAGGKRR